MGQTILTPDQHRLLELFKQDQELVSSFYLTGGTALAEFYFQHRLSEDLDFFSEQDFSSTSILKFVKDAAEKFQIEEVEQQTIHGQQTFLFHFPSSIVKVDFAYYPFSHLGEFTKAGNLKIASLQDIGVNKLQAIQTRHRGRDFVDLYFILEKGQINLNELVKNYKNKFDMSLSKTEVAKHFSSIVEAIDQPKFLGEERWENIEKFFLEKSKELTKDLLT